MEIVILIVMLGILGFQFYLIKTIKEVPKVEPKIEEKPQKQELTKEQKEKQEKIRNHFENLMNYDYETALKNEKDLKEEWFKGTIRQMIGSYMMQVYRIIKMFMVQIETIMK